MRLLHSETLELKEFVGCSNVEYVILSHTWGDEEISIQDLLSGQAANRASFAKIKNCCAQAARDGFQYVWIDTCCIDKSSSSELSEAINSMYQWYKNARICYAYLVDVQSSSTDIELQLRESRWFKRGWTLQELIAPPIVEFYAADWTEIGTKMSRQELLSEITSINVRILRGGDLSSCNIAERMSWASERVTTRSEDLAYCLMGLFDVHMPMLYGEGKRAFFRLQEEIMKGTEDYTLFAWTSPDDSDDSGLFADSPAAFRRILTDSLGRRWTYSDLRYSPADFIALGETGNRHISKDPPRITSRGVQVSFPLLYENDGERETHLALIYLLRQPENDRACINLRVLDSGSSQYSRASNSRTSQKEIVFIRAEDIRHLSLPKLPIYIKSPGDWWKWDAVPDTFLLTMRLAPQSKSYLSISTVFDCGHTDLATKAYYFPVWRKTAVGAILFSCKPTGHFLVILGLSGWPLHLPLRLPLCEVLTDNDITNTSDTKIDQAYRYLEGEASWADRTDRASKALRSGMVVTVSLRKAPSRGEGILTYALHVALEPDGYPNEMISLSK
jgi:hypothetical protein